MGTELVLLGTAGAPMPVAGRAGRGYRGITTAGTDGLRRALPPAMYS
jgi:hypothetical protein